MKNHLILIVCVFVVTSYIVVHGLIYKKNVFTEIVDLNGNSNQNVLPGFHYETMDSIQKKFNPNSYSIITLGEALSKLSNSGQKRNKRSFFSMSFPSFMSTPTDETVTEVTMTEVTKETSGMSTTQINGVTVKVAGDVSPADASGITDKMAGDVSPADDSGVTDKMAGGVSPADASGVTGKEGRVVTETAGNGVTTDTNTAVVGSTEAVNDDGYFNRIQTNVMNIVSIGQEVKESMVVAAPYLPMVFKVAVYLIPGLSTYEVLTLSVNVATITAEALARYADGESLSDVALKAGTQIAYNTLFRREFGSKISDYASGMYDSLKHVFQSHFGHDTKITEVEKDGSKIETEINSNTFEIPSTSNLVNEVETVVTKYNLNGVEIPAGTETIVTNNNYKNGFEIYQTSKVKSQNKELKEKIAEMKIQRLIDNMNSGSKSDETDESLSEENDSNGTIEVDQALFDKILEESTNLQPEFIQNMSGKQLVKYLEHMKIQLPNPKINSIQIFEALTSTMNFNDSVTDMQIAKLNQILSKLTDYYIATALKNQKLTKSTVN